MREWDFDLLGDPVPEGMGRRGRPPHLPTEENRRKVILLMALDKNEEQIAAALSITPPTLRKHYFRELRAKLEARQRVEGKLMIALDREIAKGKVSAIDKMLKIFDRHDMRLGRVTTMRPPKVREQPIGKKEQRKIEARTGHKEGEWGGLLKH